MKVKTTARRTIRRLPVIRRAERLHGIFTFQAAIAHRLPMPRRRRGNMALVVVARLRGSAGPVSVAIFTPRFSLTPAQRRARRAA